MLNIKERLKNATATTVANITIVDDITGLQLESKTLKDLGVDFTEATKEIKGGQGNTSLFVWNSDREIKITLTDAVSRMDWIAAKLGQDVKSGSVEIFVDSKEYVVKGEGANLTVQLDNVPTNPSQVHIFNRETGAELASGKFTIAGSTVTITDSTITAGKKIFVNGYLSTISQASYIDIAHDTFAKTFRVYISIPLVEKDGQQTKHTMVKQYQFPMGQLSGGFSEKTAAGGEGSDYQTEIKIIKPDNEAMGRVVVFDVTQMSPTEYKAVTGIDPKKRNR